VLDNFEQVLAAASDVVELLTAAPRLTVLVTSRVPLQNFAEYEFLVTPLELPDLATLPAPERLTSCEAVALFIQRAEAVLPDFRLTTDKARTMADRPARQQTLRPRWSGRTGS
jgi:predicted ATPase